MAVTVGGPGRAAGGIVVVSAGAPGAILSAVPVTDLAPERATTAAAVPSLIVAATPGGASGALCRLLGHLDDLAPPEALGRPGTLQRRAAALGLRPGPRLVADYLEAARRSVAPAGRALVADWWEFAWLLAALRTVEVGGPALDDELVAAFVPRPRYVFVPAADPAGQAVVWWRLLHGAAGGGPGPGDFAELRLLEGLVVEQHERWEGYFARHGLLPLRLVPSDLAGDPGRCVARVAAVLGLRGHASPRPVPAPPGDVDGVTLPAGYVQASDRLPSRLAGAEDWLEVR